MRGLGLPGSQIRESSVDLISCFHFRFAFSCQRFYKNCFKMFLTRFGACSSALWKTSSYTLHKTPIRSYKLLNTTFTKPVKQIKRFQFVKNSTKIDQKASPSVDRAARPSRSEIRRLLALAGPEKWRLGGAIGLLIISSGVTMAIPFCMGKVIDVVHQASESKKMVEKLTSICKLLLGVFFIGAVANFGRVYLMSVSGQRIIKSLREKTFISVIHQDLSFFDKNKTGELINRLSADTSLVGASITQNISDGLRSVAQAIGGLGMMIYVSPALTTVALTIVPPIAAVSIVYGRFVRKITQRVQDSLADATQVAEERISNIRTVRAFAKDLDEYQNYSVKIDHVLKLSYKEAIAKGIFWASTGLSGNLIVLSVFYNGGLMMQDSMITVGDLSAFLLYAAYVGISIAGLTSFYTELNRGLGASSRLWTLMDTKPRIPIQDGVIPTEPVVGAVDLRNLSFAYPTRKDAAVFRDLTLTLPAGKVTAVVGPSGSGKSTLAALLLRYYDPDNGKVILDGQDLISLNPYWLRQQIGIVSQEPILFSTSIRENIAYGALDSSQVTEDDIVEAAKQSNAYTFVQQFPKRFDTLVGERGVMLSGGQKQRIAIARAILRNPKILVLDEATSALDAESEFLVQEALERLMKNRTVLTIAHRLSTIRNADRIAVLDDGRIVETGSYNQLIAIKDGIFRRLVEKQTVQS